MKNSSALVFFSIMMLGAGLSWAHGIEVSKPESKAGCQTGKICSIQWDVKNVDTVKIQVRLSGKKEWTTIVEKIDNRGRHKWRVPQNMLPGTYKVLILSTKNREIHGVSKEFQISRQ